MRSHRAWLVCCLLGGLLVAAGCGAPAAPPSAAPASPTASITVPVYFVGTTPTGPRLYRELRRVAGDASLAAALRLLGEPRDPDYRTLVASSALRPTARDGQVRVQVPTGLRARPAGLTAREAGLAIQQVAYTVAGVLRKWTPVVFVDATDQPAPFLGEAPLASGFVPEPELDVLALVNVDRPAQDSRPGRRFTASGRASSFEATVPWEVRNSTGAAVLRGSSMTAGWIDRLYPWRAEVDASSLPAGRYTFVALTDDPTGGEGGGPTSDTKDITLDARP